MTRGGSVEGDAPLRLFLALRLRDDDLDRLVAWRATALTGCEQARGCRLVGRDALHLTLAFLGARPAGELPAIVGVLRDACAGAGPIALAPSRWRTTRSVGMLVLDDAGGRATALAERLHAGLEAIGVYRREQRPWLPHLTLCRFRSPPPLHVAGLPEGTCVPSDAAAYLSRLHPSGTRYEVLEQVPITTDDETTTERGGKEQA